MSEFGFRTPAVLNASPVIDNVFKAAANSLDKSPALVQTSAQVTAHLMLMLLMLKANLCDFWGKK